MKKHEIVLVYITDKKQKRNIQDNLQSFVGKRAVLEIDKNNEADAWAVKALFDKHVAFVRMSDARDGIYNLVKREKYSPIATVTGLGDYNGCLTAEVEYEGDAPEKLDLQQLHSQWVYTGPVFKEIPEVAELDNVTDYLLSLLVNQKANCDNINESFGRYVSLMKFGFSKEFNEKKREIDRLLKEYPDEKVRRLMDKLKEISKVVHSKKTRMQAYSYIIKKLKKHIDLHCKKTAMTYSISDITKQIQAFPSKLNKDGSMAKIYPLRIYYEFMPEEVLNKFFSAIALLGYLGEQVAKGDSVKKKRGRPKNVKGDPCPIWKHIIGNKILRGKWFEYIRETLDGKKNEEAGYVMKAFMDCGVVDSARYRIVKDSFGDIGTDRIYNKALKDVPEQYIENYKYLCSIINEQKEVFLSSIS